ncbi:fumarylacetoacetate hydrolase family protein [Streptomyces sp. NA04227]|uniref:fumarylacetoacetate hydrolase family protein n=1 Tax=Streptomyces sp. NA04227 TaxID=2742136 RepID=UPI0015905C5B|nr:fumarylacetoacetate hydrolase family protein [Streptomyces sp. NA04227]QKW10365.1 fumarylacetoacetate hydrolase family protein [Streptomyces sp. NA04227]
MSTADTADTPSAADTADAATFAARAADVDETLPVDGTRGTLVGRIWDSAEAGPAVVTVRDGALHDITAAFPTVRDLCEQPDPAAAVAAAPRRYVAPLADVLANTAATPRDPQLPWLLTPVDLQAVKAAGVTFVDSMLERLIEERVRGEAAGAEEVRTAILDALGGRLTRVRPGSPEAARLKEILVAQGLWSQYLEVGIGPDAEIFTKAQPLSAIGTAAEIGVLTCSRWNNPEPEVVLAVTSRGAVVGATLGNDVNLRDIEGRSALLLPKAKDNNASCAIGPFLRLFDATYGMDDVREATVRLRVEGTDGFTMDGTSSLSAISRDPEELVGQLTGPHHQYPDGAVLFLGTMFAPTADRDEPGMGFTHHRGDLVRISTESLGGLVNRVEASEKCEPWTFGAADLMRNLARRGLL